MELRAPNDHEFQQIGNYIRDFELDDRLLKKEEFSAAFRQNELIGFGRLRNHSDCVELCSLGVVTPHRRQGIGRAIVQELIRRAPGDVHLVCVIPEFFLPFDFKVVQDFPLSIQDKLTYCRSSLAVPETYVAMLFQKKHS
ncbi:MAG: GNAT family N-acetyltransferase [Bacteroidia bacterium]